MIDFTPLTNDQLVELIRTACAEAVRRGNGTAAAAQAAFLTEAEKVSVARAAAEREAERLREREAERIAKEAAQAVRLEADSREADERAEAERKRWASLKKWARMVRAALGEGWTLSIWQKDGDRRVYFDRNRAKVCVYITGNVYHAAGKLTAEGVSGDYDRALVVDLAQRAAKAWTGCPRIEPAALKANVESAPIPAAFAEAALAWQAQAAAAAEAEIAARYAEQQLAEDDSYITNYPRKTIALAAEIVEDLRG